MEWTLVSLGQIIKERPDVRFRVPFSDEVLFFTPETYDGWDKKEDQEYGLPWNWGLRIWWPVVYDSYGGIWVTWVQMDIQKL